MDLGLKDKIALVCASSRGLGRAVSEGLAREGAKVAMCARNREILVSAATEIQAKTSSETFPVVADLSSEKDITRLVESVRDRWGTIHVLVNNAGGPPHGPFETHTLQAWRTALEQNFLSALQLCQHVAPLMKQQRWGRIINLTSITAKQPVDGLILSNAVRAGVVGLAKSLANELAPYNILVNNICPGYTRTARQVEIAEAQAKLTRKDLKEIYREWERLIPLGRIAEPEEVAAMALFLASEPASYITGVTIQVDGGYVKSLL